MIAKFLARVRMHLSGAFAGFCIIMLAVGARVIQLVFFYNIRVDASYQIIATDAFINGHGISKVIVDPQNISEIIYRPLLNWPPGYSLLLAPFYWLSNGDYIVAGLALDILAALLLLFTCRKILQLLELPGYLINMFTIVHGLFVYAFYSIASSDDIAVTFFIIALYFYLRLIKYERNSKADVILLTIFLLITAFIKYLMLPVVFIIPLALTFKGYTDKIPFYRKAGWLSLFSLLIPIVSYLIYGISASDSIGPANSQQRGFFPLHLQDTYPFIAAAFITPVTSEVLLNGQPGASAVAYRLMQIVTLLLLLFLSCHFIFKGWKKKFKNITLAENFFYVSFLLLWALVALLVTLSVTISKEQTFATVFWTYVQEARYYGLITVLLHLAFFVWYKTAIRNTLFLIKPIFFTLAFFLLIELCRCTCFHFNRIMLFGKEEYSWQYEDRFQKYADSIINKAQKAHPSAPVIITGSSYYYNHRVSLYSHVPVLYDPHMLDDSVKTTKPVVVVNIIDKKDLANQKFPFINSEEAAGNFENFSFYIKYAAPK